MTRAAGHYGPGCAALQPVTGYVGRDSSGLKWVASDRQAGCAQPRVAMHCAQSPAQPGPQARVRFFINPSLLKCEALGRRQVTGLHGGLCREAA